MKITTPISATRLSTSSTRGQAAWVAVFSVAMILADGNSGAAEEEKDPRDAVIRQLFKNQEELLKRVGGLETELKNLKARPAPPALSADRAESLLEETTPKHRFPDLSIRGFGDVNYIFSDRDGQNNAFSLGQLDLFLTSRLAENFGVLNELVFKAGSDNKFGVEVERLLLQWTPSDYFNLDLGRYHSAIGYYNTAYHHGSWFQTGVNRPFIHAFGGILPLHNTGLSANGHIPSGRLGLRYIVEVGNGRRYGPAGVESDQSITDDNDYKAVNVGLIARPDWAPGLQAGVSYYHDWLTPAGLPQIDQTIVAGHVVYRRSPWEWLNELFYLRHDPDGSVPATSTLAGYTELSRKFGQFRPYGRYQYQDAPASDLIFATFGMIGLRHGPSLGLRYDFTATQPSRSNGTMSSRKTSRAPTT